MNNQTRITVKRTTRVLLYAAIGVVMLGVVAACLLLLRPVRNALVPFALERAQSAVPGNIDVGQIRWDSLGRLDVLDAVWINGTDTLATADRVSVDVRIRPLFGRRLILREAVARGLSANIPALNAISPERERKTATSDSPGLPAIAVERFDISSPRLDLTETTSIRSITVVGQFDLTNTGSALVKIERLELSDADGRFHLKGDRLQLDTEAGVLTGQGRARIAPGLAIGYVISGGSDHVSIQLSAADSAITAANSPTIELSARVAAARTDTTDIEFEVAAHIPSPAELPEPLLRFRDHLNQLGANDITLTGRIERRGRRSSAAVQLTPVGPFDGLRAHLTHEDNRVTLDSLVTHAAGLSLSASGTWAPDRQLAAHLTASGTVSGESLQQVDLRLEAPASFAPPYTVHLDATARDLRLLARARIEQPDDWLLRLTPISLSIPGEVDSLPLNYAGSLRATHDGAFEASNLEITGSLGAYVLSGTWSADRTGTWQVDCDWSVPPDGLLRMAVPSEATRQRVMDRWPSAARGRVVTHLDMSTGRLISRSNVTVQAPGWVDSSTITVNSNGSDAEVVDAAVVMPGLSINAQGRVHDGALNASAHARVERASVLRHLTASAEELEGSIDLSADGTLSAPTARAVASATYRDQGLNVPRIEVDADWAAGRLKLNAACPSGFSTNVIAIDVATLSLQSDDRFQQAEVLLAAEGSGLSLAHYLSVDRADDWTLTTDSLALQVRGSQLRTLQPFEISMQPERRSLTVKNLRLSGTSGTLSADGTIQPDSTNMRLNMDLQLPAKPPSIMVADEFWPQRIEITAAATGAHSLDATLKVSGFALGENHDAAATVNVVGRDSSVSGDLALSTGDVERATGDLTLPGVIEFFPPRMRLSPGPVIGNVNLFELPIDRLQAQSKDSARDAARLNGTVKIQGTTERPEAVVSIQSHFPSGSPMAGSKITLDGYVSARETMAGLPDEIASIATRLRSVPDTLAPAGLLMSATVETGTEVVAQALLRVPVEWSLLPPRFLVRNDAPSLVQASSDRFPLSHIAQLLPQDTGVSGSVTFDLAATGPPRDLALDGTVAIRDLSVVHANGTRVAGAADMRLGGTSRAPAVSGKIRFDNGVISVPEPPRNLHPVTGESLLWQPNPQDSTGATEAGGTSDNAGATDRPDLEIEISLVIPSALWIRGRGLDVELAGNLTLSQEGGAPVVSGELNALRGQLLFLGRTFVVDRGKAVFYGDGRMNPALDLILTTTVEGTKIFIRMQGTADAPNVSLTSEPSMEEGDIMSFLVFGKRMSELNSDQVGLVQQRATETAASFGTQLAARLSRQMGVDLITVTKGSGSGQSSLMLGKYVTRRALLKYEQSLEERATFLIDLEYFLTQTLRLETFLGQQQQSGLEVNWSRDY